METKCKSSSSWIECSPLNNLFNDIYFSNDQDYRIKPKTETTWIWVAEWDYQTETCMRSTKNPWINDTGDYSLVKPLKVYKIEESKQETLIE